MIAKVPIPLMKIIIIISIKNSFSYNHITKSSDTTNNKNNISNFSQIYNNSINNNYNNLNIKSITNIVIPQHYNISGNNYNISFSSSQTLSSQPITSLWKILFLNVRTFNDSLKQQSLYHIANQHKIDIILLQDTSIKNNKSSKKNFFSHIHSTSINPNFSIKNPIEYFSWLSSDDTKVTGHGIAILISKSWAKYIFKCQKYKGYRLAVTFAFKGKYQLTYIILQPPYQINLSTKNLIYGFQNSFEPQTQTINQFLFSEISINLSGEKIKAHLILKNAQSPNVIEFQKIRTYRCPHPF